MKRLSSFVYLIINTCTAMIGYSIHRSIFWSIIDFVFMPIAWIKWIICKEVNLELIKNTFSWFFKS